MARIFANYSFDQDNFDLHKLSSNQYYSAFTDDANIYIDDVFYEDVLELYWSSEGDYLSVFGGNGFALDSSGDVVDGQATGFLEYWWNGSEYQPVYKIDSFTVSAPDLYNTILTPSSQDERIVLSEILSGADQFTLSNFSDTANGFDGNDTMSSFGGDDWLSGGLGSDLLSGGDGADTLEGGDGVDTLSGGEGDDLIFGGATEADRRDVIYAGAGNDSADGGYGNDELHGGTGNDTMAGSYGADTLIGNQGDDFLTGSVYGDLIFGGDGFDFINGGYGNDLLNGGADGDRFFHTGVTGHGSDWIQDFSAAEGDRLHYGGAGATRDQFQVNFASSNSGDANVDEAFVIYRPTGQILWAVVDGAGEDTLMLQLGGETFDLFA